MMMLNVVAAESEERGRTNALKEMIDRFRLNEQIEHNALNGEGANRQEAEGKGQDGRTGRAVSIGTDAA
jgi:hypothetical protein